LECSSQSRNHAAEEANNLNPGALVLVDLTANKQVQRLRQDTPGELLKILQSFSRQIDSYKKKAEEIEQWKESLIFQSEELQRREEEIQSREAEMQAQLDSFLKLKRIPQNWQRNAKKWIPCERSPPNSRRTGKGTPKTRCLAWAEFQATGKLDEGQAQHLQELIDYLSGTTISIESVSEPLNLAVEILGTQQSAVEDHQQRLEQHRQNVQQQQEEVESKAEQIRNQWQAWHQAQTALDQEQAELKVKQGDMAVKQDYAETLRHYLQQEYELQESLRQLGGSSPANVSGGADLSELEKMPLENLPTEVQNLQQDLQNLFPFVIGQVEELVEEQRENEQEAYQMLYETLVGQWRTLLQQQEKLTQYQTVLGRKLRLPEPRMASSGSQGISVEPLVHNIETLRQSQTEKLQTIEKELAEIESSVEEIQDRLNQQSNDQEINKNALKEEEETLLEQRRLLAELSGQVSLYEEMLQPQQEKLAELRQNLDTAVESLNQVQETGNYQQQAIAQIRDVVMSLINPPSAE
jgi:chromosome segregation ATPase